MPTPKLTKTLSHVKKLAARLLICSTAVGVLSCCAGLKPFPTKDLFEYDAKNKVCGQYVLVDEENLKYDWVKDLPVNQCPSIFGFRSKDIPKVLDWGTDAKDYARNNCH